MEGWELAAGAASPGGAGCQGGGAPGRHLLAVRSLILGTCNLLVIGLPPGWRVLDGSFPPEVDRWHLRGDVSWAVAGRGTWRLVAPAGGGPRAVVDAALHLAPARAGVPDPAADLWRVAASGAAVMAGHPARWALGEVRRGILRRPRSALAVALACPETGRTLRLLLEGAEPAYLRALLDPLAAGLACH